MTQPQPAQVTGPMNRRYDEILTPEALTFLGELHRRFDPTRRELLAARNARYAALVNGALFDFSPETEQVRADPDWRVAPLAPGLVDRRCEITGPTETKMSINALNSGARVWLADLEDANTPMWENVVEGQLNLRDAVAGALAFTSPEGKAYAVTVPQGDPAATTIVVRPRGWHLPEKHITVDGEPTSGSLTDFGLHFFHNAKALIEKGKGPYFYLPKMESRFEARLWNDVFVFAQDYLGIPQGTIRATCLIETFPAAFEMEEILYELRDHSSGLNAGRWDYLFSAIKKTRTKGAAFLLPDRNQVTMTAPFMRAYTELLVRTCHKRGASAIGGMAAFIPSRDPVVNEEAFAKVTADKTREAQDGFDGSWVAHPGMVELCTQVFSRTFEAAGDGRVNQLDRLREDVSVSADDLLALGDTPGTMTEAGLRGNISVGIQYLHAWLAGNGAVGINNLMEDAATAEISRSQVWQWIHSEVTLDTGETVTRELVERLVGEELDALPGGRSAYAQARDLFVEVAVAEEFVDFLTLPAYERMP